MSRTYRHIKGAKLKRYYKTRWDLEHEKYEYMGRIYCWPVHSEEEFVKRTCYLKKSGVLTKKRKVVDTEDHWMTTPGWWNRMCVTRPERKRVNAALQSIQCDLEDVDIPDLGRKPHIYYW